MALSPRDSAKRRAERTRIRLEQDAFPWIGRRPIAEVEAPELLQVLRKVEATAAAILKAPKLTKPIKLDGDVSEWPWGDKARVATLAQDPMGAPINTPKGAMMVARDAQFLVVTHNKNTMEIADVIYGVTFDVPGVTKVVSMDLQSANGS